MSRRGGIGIIFGTGRGGVGPTAVRAARGGANAGGRGGSRDHRADGTAGGWPPAHALNAARRFPSREPGWNRPVISRRQAWHSTRCEGHPNSNGPRLQLRASEI